MLKAKRNDPANMETKITVRVATASDIGFVVSCHKAALPDDVLPAFGEAYLKRFYKATEDLNSAALYIAEEGGTASGFALVITEKTSMLGHLGVSSILQFAVSVLLRPTLFVLAVQQSLRKKLFPDEKTAEIAFIAVSEHARGRGVGSALIKTAGEFAHSRELAFMSTKTSNEALAEHYRRSLGAETTDEFNVAGRHYAVLRWPVP